MEEQKKIIAGLYPRVSTEDQSRYGHSLDEQEDRLKNYVIIKNMKYIRCIVKKAFRQKA